MRTINMSGGVRLGWEAPGSDLVCFLCKGTLDIKTIYANSVECANFVWPDIEALQAGEYFYLHKRCSNIKGDWYMMDVKTIIGKDRFPSLRDAWRYFKKTLPPGCWERICAEWLPPAPTKRDMTIKQAKITRQAKITKRLGWLAIRFAILKRDAYRCRLCGVAAKDADHVRLEVDHITPSSKGGTNDPSNLWTLCFSCNRGKGVQEL